jgi:acetolactate synthase-1/2/3 large subunit
MKSAEHERYTAADALTDALVRGGITHVFLNSGTDYPPLIESWAKFTARGRALPEIIICPHETVAMSAAQGFAQLTGKPAGVFVHVDVGTQNIGGALANAFRARIPVLMLAGISPYTMDGELRGTRDNPIQFLQNCADQGSLVREYVKHSAELRSGRNIQKNLYRAIQIATSDPPAPVYLMAPREVLEEEGVDIGDLPVGWQKPSPLAIDPDTLDTLTRALVSAKNPLIATSYLGRQAESVEELVKLCETLAIPVVETPPSYVNFPGNHPLHLGANLTDAIANCDLLFVIDNDVPWIPSRFALPEGCRLIYLDRDPIKNDIPLWHYPAELFIEADSLTALRQLNRSVNRHMPDRSAIASRRERIMEKRGALESERNKALRPSARISPAYLTARIGEIIDDDTILINEAITNYPIVETFLPRDKPGTRYASFGSSLGWHGGAAIGAKLACPDRDVVAVTGDGSYIFSCPTAVHWTARKYKTPFMTVIYNNGGWHAPKEAVRNQYPNGYAARQNLFWNEFEPAPDYGSVAKAAGDAFTARVEDPSQLKDILTRGLEAVHAGKCAVIDVVMERP